MVSSSVQYYMCVSANTRNKLRAILYLLSWICIGTFLLHWYIIAILCKHPGMITKSACRPCTKQQLALSINLYGVYTCMVC